MVCVQVYQMTGVKGATAQWATNTHDGAWIRNQTAGGCRNYISEYSMNVEGKGWKMMNDSYCRYIRQ